MTEPEGIEALIEDLREKTIATVGLAGLTEDQLSADAPLFSEETGLDSVDVLELVVMVEKEYGVAINSKEVGAEAFQSLRTLATFIASRRAER